MQVKVLYALGRGSVRNGITIIGFVSVFDPKKECPLALVTAPPGFFLQGADAKPQSQGFCSRRSWVFVSLPTRIA